jgi:hypothetical protein
MLRRSVGKVIQRGEVTGHAHRISEGEAVILEQYEEAWERGRDRFMDVQGKREVLTARFLEVKTPTTITHEEHGPVTLTPGLYEILQAREFDYAANLGRRVRD